VALAVGSQRVMFAHPEARASFALRQYAPSALLFANLGAVQLNYGFTLQHCREAVAAVGADALYLHLNPLQEAVQPEGDTNFAGLAARLGEIAAQLEVPVVLKEVGAGIGPEDAALALRHGIRYLDVAGAGGTSWSRIEHARKTAQGGAPLGLVFQDWGIPTPLALRLLKPYRHQLELFASGGIRTGIDMAKAIILGARLCGVAQPFLNPAMDSADAVIQAIHELRQEFVTAMFLLGRPTVASLHGDESLLLP
jgi:isopentenyl-diphosphate delta-isomerase